MGTTALLAGAPLASAAVGPKTIAVDGDPIDWTGVASATPDTSVESNGEYIWTDAAGDDTGAGAYTYPTDTVFVAGSFDLTEVRITADADNLYFLIKLGAMTNPWISDPGISLQKIGIFIDTAAAGATAADPNVLTQTGFEYWAIIAQVTWQPENAKVFNSAGAWWPISYAADSTTDAIEASIPLHFLGDPSLQTWSIYVWLGGQDGGGPRGWRDVTAAGGQWNFGGGADHPFDPAVIDLAFSTTQATELSTYTTTTKATVSGAAAVSFASLGFVPDAAAPVITSVTPAPSFSTATITWTTDELATTKVMYGTASGTLTSTATVDDVTLSHAALLTGLIPRTTYYFKVVSTDVAGNTAESAEQSFQTTVPPARNFAEWVGSTFHWADNLADDVGDGDYTYPMNGGPLRWIGKADLTDVNITRGATALHIQIQNYANPTPNSDTEAWRQRMGAVAIFIDQDHVFNSGGRSVGLVGTGAELTDPHPMNVSVAPDFAFEYLVVVDFQNRSAVGDARGIGEMFVFNSTWNAAQQRWSLIYVSSTPQFSPEPDTGQVYAEDGTEVNIWLNYSVLGNSDNWTYAIAGMLFDDAARTFEEGGIRQVRTTNSDWAGGGSNGPMNPNVYDLAFYPDTTSQQTDLSEYVSTAYTSITRAVQVNLTAKWYALRSVTNVLGMASSISSSEVKRGETAGIVSFVTDRNSPVAGSSVVLTANPASAVTISGSPSTTNAFGAAMFAVQGNAVTSDTVVTLTATATVGTSTVSESITLTVLAPVYSHTYRVFLSAADGMVASGSGTTVTAVFTDNGAPISGASVSLQSNNALLAVLTSSATTNAQGVASFSVRAGYTDAGATATLTATATNGTSTSSATLSVTVLAFAHRYALSGSATPIVVAADATTTVTFTFADLGVPQAGASVSIAVSSSAAFEIVGNALATTGANGQVSFTLKAKSVTSDTSAVVTATASNGTAAPNVATATVVVVAQGAAPTAAQGVDVAIFGGVAGVLAVVAAAFAYLWMKAKRGGKPPQKEEPVEDEGL